MKREPDSIVVIPWDFSEYAKRALKFALGEFPCDQIRVLCVLEHPNPYTPDFVITSKAKENAITKCNEQFEEEVPSSRYPGLQFLALFGDPSSEIVRFATQFAASIIVMSTHGRTGIKRLVMGSVTEKVLRNAKNPVLILPYAMASA